MEPYLKVFFIQSFPRYLANKGFIESTYPDEIDEIISDYYSNIVSYRKVAEVIPTLYASSLKGKLVADVNYYAKKFMKAYIPKHIFSYSKPLIDAVSQLVDFTVALSGSPFEVIKELKTMGFDKIVGSYFEQKSGIYTGKVIANLILGEVKAFSAKIIAEELDIDLTRSIAFGDTDQDEHLLSLVGNPIAIKPTRKQREICISRSWKWVNKEDLYDLNNITEWIKSGC